MDKIKDLKEGKSVTIRGRVLEVGEKKVVNTKYGPAELSEAVIGDDTGRVKVTLWRDKAGSLEVGDVVEIRDGWTTSYKGEVQVNVNRRSEIIKIEDSEAPAPEEIPEERPRSTARVRPSRSSSSRRRENNRPSP